MVGAERRAGGVHSIGPPDESPVAPEEADHAMDVFAPHTGAPLAGTSPTQINNIYITWTFPVSIRRCMRRCGAPTQACPPYLRTGTTQQNRAGPHPKLHPQQRKGACVTQLCRHTCRDPYFMHRRSCHRAQRGPHLAAVAANNPHRHRPSAPMRRCHSTSSRSGTGTTGTGTGTTTKTTPSGSSQ